MKLSNSSQTVPSSSVNSHASRLRKILNSVQWLCVDMKSIWKAFLLNCQTDGRRASKATAGCCCYEKKKKSRPYIREALIGTHSDSSRLKSNHKRSLKSLAACAAAVSKEC